VSKPTPILSTPVGPSGEHGQTGGADIHNYIGPFERKEYVKALDSNRKELENCLAIGKVAPDTIVVRHHEAIILAFMKEVDEAVGSIGRTYNDCVEVHNENHDLALRTMITYARILVCAQRYAEAEVWSEKACHLYEKNAKDFGSTNPAILAATFQRAMILDKLRNPEAEKIYEKASEGWYKELGAEHPDTIWSRYLRADYLLRHNRHEDARTVCREVYSACQASEDKSEKAKEQYNAPDRIMVREVQADAKVKIGTI